MSATNANQSTNVDSPPDDDPYRDAARRHARHVGANLRAIRKQHGLSQQRLALAEQLILLRRNAWSRGRGRRLAAMAKTTTTQDSSAVPAAVVENLRAELASTEQRIAEAQARREQLELTATHDDAIERGERAEAAVAAAEARLARRELATERGLPAEVLDHVNLDGAALQAHADHLAGLLAHERQQAHAQAVRGHRNGAGPPIVDEHAPPSPGDWFNRFARGQPWEDR